MNNAMLLNATNTAVNAVNSALTNATNVVAQNIMNQNSPTSSTLQFLLFVVGVVVVTLGGYYLYARYWGAASAAPTPAGIGAGMPPAPTRQVWCFVGEDATGRWCVQVPSDSACSADRAYDSESGCVSPTTPVASLAPSA
jgi:hypothetical protein